jgi:hypothetical protein
MNRDLEDREKIFMRMALMFCGCCKENDALRARLRETGWSHSRPAQKALRHQESFEDAFLLFARLCREMLETLRAAAGHLRARSSAERSILPGRKASIS